MQTDVLQREDKFPKGRHFWVLPPGRQKGINNKDDEVSRDDSQGAAGEKAPQVDWPTARERRDQLPANQVAAENEEQIDPDPAESIYAAGQFETEKRGVVNDHHDNGKSTEKVETRLTFV